MSPDPEAAWGPRGARCFHLTQALFHLGAGVWRPSSSCPTLMGSCRQACGHVCLTPPFSVLGVVYKS